MSCEVRGRMNEVEMKNVGARAGQPGTNLSQKLSRWAPDGDWGRDSGSSGFESAIEKARWWGLQQQGLARLAAYFADRG